jgi:hypothetical protein
MQDSSSTLATPIRRNQPSTTTRLASAVERHQPSAVRRNQPSTMARSTSISSRAPNINISNGKSSKDSNSTLTTPVGRNQPSAKARYTSISSLAPNINIGNGKSSKDSSSTLSAPIKRTQPFTTTRSASEVKKHQPSADGRNQPSATAEISISSSVPNVNIGNNKSNKDNNSTLATSVGRNQPSTTATQSL